VADINIPGISSKYNTAGLIEDLVATERIKLERMEEDLSKLERNKTIWRQLNRELGNLQRIAKSLYGFENPFSDKFAGSSDERILTALASRNAPADSYSITVKEVATSDHFASSSLDKDFRIDTGSYTFKIGAKSLTFHYRGGTLEDFARRLTKRGEGLIRARTIWDTPDTRVMIIEAIPTGAANRLVFEDDAASLGLKTKMIHEKNANSWEIALESAFKNLTSDAGSSKDGLRLSDKGIIVGSDTLVRLPLEEELNIEPGLVLEYRYRVIGPDENPLNSPTLPAPENRFGEVPANSLPSDDTSGAEGETGNVVRIESGAGNLSLPPIDFDGIIEDGLRVVRVEASSLPESISAIVLDNNDGNHSVEIADIRIFNPKQPKGFAPVSPTSQAGDAIIEFMGIEIRRPDNSIDDLIDGLTLNVKRPSSEPVELSINPDLETAKDGIISFVFNYNQLITRISVLTNDSPKIVDELEYLDDEERKDLEDQLGYMRGESILIQLKNQLQSIVSNPYSTSGRTNLSLLAHIGISTNASSGSTGVANFSKLRGYLEIDEEKLERALEADIDAIKELFGKDTNGDLVIDSGVASAIDSYLGSYVRSTGFVGNRIARIDGQIDNVEEDIANYEQHLEDYEADLRRQYGNMEAILNQLENSSKELENFALQQDSER